MASTLIVIAALVQAFGSVGALGIAIFLDRRAAERMRQDRREEEVQRRRAAHEATSRTEFARLAAIYYASEAFAAAAAEIRPLKPGQQDTIELKPQLRQRIRGSEGAINALLAQPADVAPEVLGALAQASQSAGYWRSRAESEQPFVGPGNQVAYLDTLREAQQALRRIYDQARADLESVNEMREQGL